MNAKKSEQKTPIIKKPVFTPPNQVKFNRFGKQSGAKFNPGTFKTQHKG